MAGDGFSDRCGELLTGGYDCVDRVVLNAYYPLGHSPGGFRYWWRLLHGDDAQLDDTHLMRMAGTGVRPSGACLRRRARRPGDRLWSG